MAMNQYERLRYDYDLYFGRVCLNDSLDPDVIACVIRYGGNELTFIRLALECALEIIALEAL